MTTQTVKFTQKIFIGKPAEDVWDAITRKEIVDQYYLTPLMTNDLSIGKEIIYGRGNKKMIKGKVLQMDRPFIFSHSFNFLHNQEDKESIVKYEIEDLGKMSSLILTHDDFIKETQTYKDISSGWPIILSSLKTLLETGEELPWPRV
jgi:uncharacterized protein YndB with AHSA1/START domain